MRLTLHTLLWCCVLTAVMPLMRSAVLRKRFKGRLLTKRDAAREVYVGLPQTAGDPRTELSASSLFFSTRSRRSAPKTSGCFLFSCAYHDLLHRLSQMHDNDKRVATAPKDKLNSIGRRRRSADDPTDAGVLEAGPGGFPCWVCLFTTDNEKPSLVESLGWTPSVEDWPRPTQQAADGTEEAGIGLGRCDAAAGPPRHPK